MILRDSPDRASAERSARGLTAWLDARGLGVARIEVPPPGQHPHQAQMNALLAIVAAFGLAALLLAGVLTAAAISALLAQQVRQIGVMKAIGARASQIVRLYLAMVLVLAVSAVVLAVPAGLLAGQFAADRAVDTLNFTVADSMPSWSALPAAIAIGLSVPLLVTLAPIRRGTGVTIREAITATGAAEGGKLTAAINGWRLLSRPVALGLANAFRRRGRLTLTLVVLAASGAIFMTALSVARSWEVTLDLAFEGRRFDLDVRLDRPAAADRVVALVRAQPGVRSVEAWPVVDAARIHGHEADVVATYPGGVHGGLTVFAPPVGSRLLELPLVQGRRLGATDIDAAVVNRRRSASTSSSEPASSG